MLEGRGDAIGVRTSSRAELARYPPLTDIQRIMSARNRSMRHAIATMP